MSRRRTAILAVVAAAGLLLAGCASGGSRSGADPSASSIFVPLFGSPRAAPASPTPTPSVAPAPTPSATPTHKPKPSVVKLTKAPIPAWPKGSRWYGPGGSMGSTGTRSVALTFDDGPGPETSQVLDLLDAYHIKATFCLIGRQVHAYRSVVKRMIADGQTICNHTWDHDEKLGTRSQDVIMKNLQRTNDAIHAIDADAKIMYFRHPGGNFTNLSVQVCEHLGMRPLYWGVDTRDWDHPGTDKILKTLNGKTHRGSIVLMHDGGGDRSETLAALKEILPIFKDRYTLVPLPTTLTSS